jgi:N-methylhydantoinase B
VVTSQHAIVADSGGPGRFRGGCGAEKGGTLTAAEGTVMSYCCDRARSITWGIQGGLPSIPQGVWLTKQDEAARCLGAIFSNVPVGGGDYFTRCSAGGGGYGDPLEREPERVRDDVADGYVTLDRARKDYGVVLQELNADLGRYEIDPEATARERERIRSERLGWLSADAEQVADLFRAGELKVHDLVRQYGVILDWGTGQLLSKTTEQFRAMLRRRAASHWRQA